jgi:hypothetical protein
MVSVVHVAPHTYRKQPDGIESKHQNYQSVSYYLGTIPAPLDLPHADDQKSTIVEMRMTGLFYFSTKQTTSSYYVFDKDP